MKLLYFCILSPLALTLIVGCQAHVSTPAAAAFGDSNVATPASPATPATVGSTTMDFNGTWEGDGTVDPRTLWSLNQSGSRPMEESTSCHVRIKISYLAGSRLTIQAATISLPSYGSINAKLTNEVSGANGTQKFDPPDFQFQPKDASGNEFTLGQIMAGGYSGAFGYGSFSQAAQTLAVFSQGPYIGTYPDGSGAAFTAERDFSFSWSNGSLNLDQASFWSYGSSVAHATDAECNHVVLKRVD